MTWRERTAELLKKYKHGWVFSYFLVYMPWFLYLEKHVTKNYHVIHSAIDDEIPFIEYFIVPYLLWFVFIAAVMLYFFFTDVEGFYRLWKIVFAGVINFLFAGMTIFLIVSTLVPNGLNIRPYAFERDNIFVDMVKLLYRADTPTNVMPSIHVYNSLAACIAISQSRALQKHRAVCTGAYALAALIIMATMFLKQHSVIDVASAAVMAHMLYQFFYVPDGRRYAERRLSQTAMLQNK